MKRRKAKKARYVVDRVGEGRGGTNVFYCINHAVEYFYSPGFKRVEGGKRFVAKEIFYSLDVDESRGKMKIQVTPIGDFPSMEPYYLVDEYQGTYDTYGGEVSGTMCKITSYEDLNQLVQNGLPEVRGKSIITHGILFFEKKKRKSTRAPKK